MAVDGRVQDFGQYTRVTRAATTAESSTGPAIRSARAHARRRLAACRHDSRGWIDAPRPGSRLDASGRSRPSEAMTRRSSPAGARSRQPTQVRIGVVSPDCGIDSTATTSVWLDRLRIRADVNSPPGHARGQSGVLSLTADRQRELVVRHRHARGTGYWINDHHARDASR
jgi:hypothetical protein